MEEENKKEPLWDHNKLQVGNWFSGTKYYRIKEMRDGDKQAVTHCINDNQELKISYSILDEDMHNANVYEKEEKIAITQLVKIFKKAYSTAFTVCFSCKIDDKQIAEKLAGLSQ